MGNIFKSSKIQNVRKSMSARLNHCPHVLVPVPSPGAASVTGLWVPLRDIWLFLIHVKNAGCKEYHITHDFLWIYLVYFN